MSTFNVENIKSQHRYITTIQQQLEHEFYVDLSKKNIHLQTCGSIFVTKERKNVIKHGSNKKNSINAYGKLMSQDSTKKDIQGLKLKIFMFHSSVQLNWILEKKKLLSCKTMQYVVNSCVSLLFFNF